MAALVLFSIRFCHLVPYVLTVITSYYTVMIRVGVKVSVSMWQNDSNGSLWHLH